MINNYVLDVNNAENSLKELQENTTNDVLFSIGSGVYISAELKELKKVKVNLGVDIFEDMSLDKANEYLENKKKELIKVMERLKQQEQELLKSISGLEQVLNAAQQKIAEAQKTQQPQTAQKNKPLPIIS